jgi:uncharacterized protein with HEPN domain
MSKADLLSLHDYLIHISEAIRRAGRYIEGVSKNDFLNDNKTQDAVIRTLEVIGEACNNIMKNYSDFIVSHPEIPWKDAYGMLNRISHGYHSVNLNRVWDTVTDMLPALAVDIDKALVSLG